MKLRLLLPTLLLSMTGLHAGGFGGPAAFRNGSPLTTGTDGTYQAVARATNVTGIFTWSISGGAQTTDHNFNTWVFFVDGQLLQGQTTAAISGGKIAGVLNSGGTSSIPTSSDGSVTLPLIFIVPGNGGAGDFNGTIDLHSPVAAFNGKGTLSGTPARVDTLVAVSQNAAGTVVVNSVAIAVPGSTLGTTQFKFRGTRVNTAPIASSSTSSSS